MMIPRLNSPDFFRQLNWCTVKLKEKELDVFGMKLDVTGIKLLMILKLLRTFPVARR